MTFLAALIGLAIGLLLGTLGGGGAILTVPALVYLLGLSVHQAMVGSLVVVGTTALVGVAGHARAGHVRWSVGLAFGLVGTGAAWLGAQLTRDVGDGVLMAGFAAVLVVAAAGMLWPYERPDRIADREPGRVGTWSSRSMLAVVGSGLLVGLLTGAFGVGGGFLAVPALVLALGLPMPTAIGTSLVVITVNSAAALAARLDHVTVPWETVLPLLVAAMAGSLAGRPIAARLSPTQLTRGFAVLLLVVAVGTAAAA